MSTGPLFEQNKSAFDRAFAGVDCHIIDPDGNERPMAMRQWRADPDDTDLALFVEPCDGSTLDIGCGPGRLTAALSERAVPSMGIDTSLEAVRQARDRGAVAIRRDVFASVPGEGRWDFAILADGNIGIGGDPVKLLRRAAELVRVDGHLIVEVGEHGIGLSRETIRLRVSGHLTEPFDWATVGMDAIGKIARSAGLAILRTTTVNDRHAATLVARDR